MKKMHSTTALLAGCSVLVMLSGCDNKQVYHLSDGTYEMETKGETDLAPAVTFDLKENTFVFTYDLLSSYANIGTITVNDGTVVGVTDDDNYTFIFEIVGDDAVKFVAEGSGSTQTVEGKTAVPDGSIFYAEIKHRE